MELELLLDLGQLSVELSGVERGGVAAELLDSAVQAGS